MKRSDREAGSRPEHEGFPQAPAVPCQPERAWPDGKILPFRLGKRAERHVT